jgi:Divergent InlB B-repeat domain
MLDLGAGYSITATPKSSVFSNWTSGSVVTFTPTLSFIMQSNLVLTADFSARQSPAVLISSPTVNARVVSPIFNGTATTSPVLAGVNSNNVRLTGVEYWLTNAATASVMTGAATMAPGAAVSNWSITATPLPGTNTLGVRCQDISGGFSPIVSRKFFYKVPAPFTLLKSGTGNGTFTATAAVAGDILPANGAMLNLTESYTVTAKPDQFSVFSKWDSSLGSSVSPTLPFIMQAGSSATAVFNALPPVVTISSPAANLRTSTPVFNGTASSHLGLAGVSYTLVNSFGGASSGGSATLTAGSGSVSNWSIAVVPLPGTNTLTVTGEDGAGDTSASVSRTFFYKVPAQLEILQAGTGRGTLKGTASIPGDVAPTNGARLNLGERYTITATPGKSSLFSNWVSAEGVTVDPVLSFIMQSNLVLTATFDSNFFPAAAGTYNGLFYPANAVAVETSGMLNNFVLRNTGACSGSLLQAGQRYPFTANFDASGKTAFSAGPLQVDLTLDSTNPQITGTVSGSGWTANLVADLASDNLPSAEYTILFEASTNVPADSPPGDGYALVTNHAGIVTLSGAMADGTSYSQNVPVSRSGDLPVYAVLYTNQANPNPGLLLGSINLTNLQAAAPSNVLTWIKNQNASAALYTNGFTNILSSQGALWTNPPAKSSAISLTDGQLVISNSGLFLAFTNIAVSNNILTNLSVPPTNLLTGAINPKTGLLTFTFDSGNGTNRATGVILQNTTNAGGYFLTPTNAGAFNLQP